MRWIILFGFDFWLCPLVTSPWIPIFFFFLVFFWSFYLSNSFASILQFSAKYSLESNYLAPSHKTPRDYSCHTSGVSLLFLLDPLSWQYLFYFSNCASKSTFLFLILSLVHCSSYILAFMKEEFHQYFSWKNIIMVLNQRFYPSYFMMSMYVMEIKLEYIMGPARFYYIN